MSADTPSPAPPPADEWLSVAEAAALTGYHPEHVRELLRERRVRGRKVAGVVWQIERADLLDYVERMRERGDKPGRK